MLYWIRFPLIRFLLFFIAGILLSRIIDFNSLFSILGFYSTLFLYFILLIVLKKDKFLHHNLLLGITALSALTLSGAIISSGRNYRQDPDQVINSREKIQGYLAKIQELNTDDTIIYKMTLHIRFIKTKDIWVHKTGKVILTIKNIPSRTHHFNTGDLILVSGSPSEIIKPENPDQFNYRNYMFYQGIYLQHYITSAQCALLNRNQKANIINLAGNLRDRCRLIFKRHIPDDESRALVTALTLGLKDELSEEMTQDYSKAGISHILAVSGLHVGIFYIILFTLFKPFNRNEVSAWVISVLIILILIIFAFVTGLSPSVLRSVILFSLIEIGRRLGRKSISFNTLAASALMLLIINPFYIYFAGFQLSYLAVAGIIFFQPHLYKIIIFTNDMADYIWKLVTVAVAAQVTTFPVTLYYFHSFPVYFMISNIIAIPAAFLVLSFGLGILSLHFLEPLANFAGSLVTWVIRYFNISIHTLSSLPGSQFTGVRINLVIVLLFYGIIFLIMMLITNKKVIYLYGIAVCVVCLLTVNSIHMWISTHREKIIFYSSASGPLIELVSGRQGFLFADSLLISQPQKIKRIIENHCILDSHPAKLISPSCSQPGIPGYTGRKYDLILWKGLTILIVRDLRSLRSRKNVIPVKVDFLVLSRNAGFDIENLNRHFSPACWIIDRSSRSPASEFAMNFLSAGKLSCISISDTGAYIYRIE